MLPVFFKNNGNIDKETIEFLKFFDLKNYTDCDTILIPLFLQNGAMAVEELLNYCTYFQKDFLQFIDRVVGGEVQISDLVQRYEVKKLSNESFKNKAVFKLGMRLLKKYNIDPKMCPNIVLRQTMSSLRYLFQKYYDEQTLSMMSFLLFVKEHALMHDDLKFEALNQFYLFGDKPSALKFLEMVQVDNAKMPNKIADYISSPDNNENYAGKENFDNRINYYDLNLSLNSVYFVDSLADFDKSIETLNNYTILGIDCEWKPSFCFTESETLSLIQIAVQDKVFLFDMIYFLPVLSADQWEKFGSVFSDKRTTKVVYGFASDVKQLGALNKTINKHLKSWKENCVDLNDVKAALLEHYPACFSYKTVEYKGLSELVYLCFGKPLDKLEQCSFWSVRPLMPSQIKYASIDAFCLIEIYNYLQEKATILDISEWTKLKSSPSTEQGGAKAKIMSPNEQNQRKEKYRHKSIKAADLRVICDTMFEVSTLL